MYWIFAGMWFSSFLVWTALVFSPGKRRLGLRLFLFLLPVVMFGACIVQVHTYTICPCFQCPYMDWAARRALGPCMQGSEQQGHKAHHRSMRINQGLKLVRAG